MKRKQRINKNIVLILILCISGNGANHFVSDNNFGDGTKEKEEETVLEEITRKAAIGR